MKKIAAFFLFVFFSTLFIPHAKAVKFAVMGDTKDFLSGSGAMASTVAKIKKKKPRAVIVVGDLINDCNDDATCQSYWDGWKSAASPLLKKIYPAMGNHDRVSANADADWQNNFDLPANGPADFRETVYSFNKGGSHFIVLNSSNPYNLINSVQRAWLEQDLVLNQKKKHKFVFFHAPAYPASLHIGSSLDAYPAERDALWEILDRHNVSGVFAGHEHFFNRRLIDSSVFAGATSSIYQFTVGRTDVAETYPVPQAGMSCYYYLDNHFAIVEAKKRSVRVDLYSASGTRVNAFRYKK